MWLAALGVGCSSSPDAPLDLDLSVPPDLAPTSCSSSIASYCTPSRPECAPFSRAAWCAGDGGLPMGYSAPVQRTCGAYSAIIVASADVATWYVYDSTSKALVAVLVYDANHQSSTCSAGPASFTLSCSSTNVPLCG